MNKSPEVVITYNNTPHSKVHNFTLKAIKGGKTFSKNFSIGTKRTLDEAYEDAVKGAPELARIHGCTVNIKTKEELLRAAASNTGTGKRSSKKKSKPSHKAAESASSAAASLPAQHANQLVERFGHSLKFSALIKHAVKLFGVEKVEEILLSGLEELTAAKEELARERSVRLDTNRKIADAILAARDAGVHMNSPDDEIEDLINLAIQSRERKKNRPNNSYAGKKYKLGDEIWEGEDHMPASFSQWLRADLERNIDDLLVP